MHLTELKVWLAEFPLLRPLRHSSVNTTILESVVVEVRLDGSEKGIAEVRANGAYATGEDRGRILGAFSVLDVTGCRPHEATVSLLERSRLAAMALDVAVCDAISRRDRVPLHALWSPMTQRRSRVRTHGQVAFGEGTAEARELVAAGFDRLKIRVGGPGPDDDIRRVRAISRAAGPGVSLILDANGGWSIDQARLVGAAITDLPVVWIEQPVATVDELIELHHGLPVRVYADESASDAESIGRLVGAVDGVHLKLEKCGTVRRLLAAVATARGAGLEVALGQMDQGRLGCAVTTQLAVALALPRAELWGWAHIAEDLTDALRLESGEVVVPDGAGSGIERIKTSMLKEIM